MRLKVIKKIFEVIRPEQVFPLVLILLDLAAAKPVTKRQCTY